MNTYNIKMEEKNDSNIFYEQILPLILTIVIFMGLGFILYVYILLLNKYTSIDISMDLRITDVLVGFTIYLKTSVDFAIYIGNLMKKFPGWKNRIPIEIGTAFGNALGTLIVLTIWNFFREVDMVLAIMIFIASLVLLKLSEDGFEHAFASNRIKGFIYNISQLTYFTVQKINVFFSPIVGRILPNLSFDKDKANKNTLAALFMLSFSVPFILGLDDFAGYVPLFNVVNVFGFAIGVFAGHMVLNALLFMSPQKTIKAVSNPYISLAGGYVFIILALIGFREIIHILHLF